MPVRLSMRKASSRFGVRVPLSIPHHLLADIRILFAMSFCRRFSASRHAVSRSRVSIPGHSNSRIEIGKVKNYVARADSEIRLIGDMSEPTEPATKVADRQAEARVRGVVAEWCALRESSGAKRGAAAKEIGLTGPEMSEYLAGKRGLPRALGTLRQVVDVIGNGALDALLVRGPQDGMHSELRRMGDELEKLRATLLPPPQPEAVAPRSRTRQRKS